MRVVDFFSGIGGFSLGLERAGFKTVAFSEIDPYACAVLKKHWPHVPNLGDIRTLEPGTIPDADLWCGGFPCQPFSSAARGRNKATPLWGEMFRCVERCRPKWIVAENVPGIARFTDRVLSDLEGAGYEATALALPSNLFGAPHEGYRQWFIAKANSNGKFLEPVNGQMADHATIPKTISWPDSPKDIRVDDGVSNRVDRLRCLGNAIVPQIATWIGERIKKVEMNPQPKGTE